MDMEIKTFLDIYSSLVVASWDAMMAWEDEPSSCNSLSLLSLTGKGSFLSVGPATHSLVAVSSSISLFSDHKILDLIRLMPLTMMLLMIERQTRVIVPRSIEMAWCMQHESFLSQKLFLFPSSVSSLSLILLRTEWWCTLSVSLLMMPTDTSATSSWSSLTEEKTISITALKVKLDPMSSMLMSSCSCCCCCCCPPAKSTEKLPSLSCHSWQWVKMIQLIRDNRMESCCRWILWPLDGLPEF